MGFLSPSQVDSILYNLPAILNGGQVQVHQHGTGVLLQTNFGLVVHYDLLHHVRVTAPQGYKGHLCGLCGNYNGQQEDDHLLPDGHNAPDVTAFGSAWKTPEVACSDDCSKDDCPECTKEKEEVFQKPNYCGILVVPEGPFSSCYNTINPAPYFHACVRDLCLTEGNTNVLCQSVQSYVATCQDAGVTIEAWRKPSFCRKWGSEVGNAPRGLEFTPRWEELKDKIRRGSVLAKRLESRSTIKAWGDANGGAGVG